MSLLRRLRPPRARLPDHRQFATREQFVSALLAAGLDELSIRRELARAEAERESDSRAAYDAGARWREEQQRREIRAYGEAAAVERLTGGDDWVNLYFNAPERGTEWQQHDK